MILHFMHGWGWNARFWRNMTDALPTWQCEADDRGYFGSLSIPVCDEPCILVAHSFGAMRALSAMPATCFGLIAINGFERFTPEVPQRIVERMIGRFTFQPDNALADFRRRCGSDEPFSTPDTERLRTDLLALRDEDRSGEVARCGVPILSIQSANDQLLPLSMRETVFAGAPLLERIMHPTGSHLLPLTDAAFCARAIADFVERVA